MVDRFNTPANLVNQSSNNDPVHPTGRRISNLLGRLFSSTFRTSLTASPQSIGSTANTSHLHSISARQPHQSIKKQLTAWVNAGPENERADRKRAMIRIMETKPTLDANGRISVGGNLNLINCTSLSSLPEGLRVDGSLYLEGCISLTHLPDSLSVGGDLTLPGCTSLTILPEDLSVSGDLDLYGCTSLTHLPDNLSLSVGRNLGLDGCTSLTHLPDSLSVGGNLSLSRCTSLTHLPEDLSVGRHLTLINCTSLSSLPDDLSVGGHLGLDGCTSLTHLPEGLSVGGDLYLRSCTRLTSLPNGLSVGGDLDLRSCTRLTSLPNGLSVHGYLNLDGCTSLTHLPEGLSVSGRLSLSGCRNLTSLAEDLSVDGDLDLSGCTSLTSLPHWITTLGPLADGHARQIDLTGTGLSAAVLEQLENADHPGIQFIFGHAAATFTNHPDLHSAIGSWLSSDESQALTPDDWGLNGPENQNLTTFLSRLHQTADAQNVHSRPHLQARISAFLRQMQHNPNGFRALAMERVSQGISSCDDRVILIMNNIELLTRIEDARSCADPAAALRKLAKSLVALEVVHRHAARKCASMGFVDPIEVYLAFEIKLKADLDLPVSTENMLFEGCAGLTTNNIAEAKQEALNILANEDNVTQYLNQWEPWQQFERGTSAHQLNWNALPTTTHPFVPSDTCIISSKELREMTHPVCIGEHLYDLNALLTHWVVQGTNPTTNLPLSLDQLEKVARP